MADHLLQLLACISNKSTAALSDADLLGRFTNSRDHDAFAELVRRHGPVVYRICRRLVGSAAEDAFQATFLVLATRSTAAAASRSVGGWLVAAAGRVARQTRRSALRRAHYESRVSDRGPTDSPDATTDLRDQFRILDEELARLPERLLAPVVSCLLQGRTQDQVAAELGHTARTVRRRLDEAKRLLRLRLERRGVTPVVAAGLVVGAGAVSAAVPAGLNVQTVAIVFDFLTGGAAVAAAPVVLAKGVAMTMFARKVAQFFAVTLAVGLTGLGIVLADGPQPPPVIPNPIPAASSVPGVAGGYPIGSAPSADSIKPMVEPIGKRDEAEMRSTAARIVPTTPATGPRALIDVICLRAPSHFCEKAGLTADDSSNPPNAKSAISGSWILNRREARLFNALIRAESTIEVISRPQIATLNGQATQVNVGRDVEVVTEMEASTRDGATVYMPKTKKLQLGTSLKLTPTISSDGKFVSLRLDGSYSDLAGSTLDLPVKSVAMPGGKTENHPGQALQLLGPDGVKVQTFLTTVVLPDAGTGVICGLPETTIKDGAKRQTEMVWVLTAHIVRPER